MKLIEKDAHNMHENGMRKPFPLARRSSQQQAALEEQDEVVDTTPSTTSTVDIAAFNAANKQLAKELSHSLSSSDGAEQLPYVNGKEAATIISPPSFALVSPPIEPPKRKKDLKKMENAQQEQLRRELDEVNMARKEADERIIALENLVKTLTLNNTHPVDASNCIASIVGDGAINKNGVGNKMTDSTAITSQKFHKLQQQHQAIVGNNNKYSPIIQAQQQSCTSTPKLSVAGPITDL